MNGAALVVGTFLLVTLLILGPYYFFVVRPESAAQEVLRQRIRTGGSARPRAVRQTLLKEVERLSAIGPLNNMLTGRSRVAEHLRDTIRLSGLKVTPGQVVLGSACMALAAYVLSLHWIPRVWAAVVVSAVAGLLPYVAIRVMYWRRLNKFAEQFPEAVDLIARTLRAGHAFTTGMRLASEELPAPVNAEFKLLYEQQNYGMPLPDALKALAERIPIIDTRFFVTAVLTQREAGGNLAEVLDNLSAVIRERFRIKRQIRVITAHGRMTGLVLAAMPPAIATYLLIRTPQHFKILIEDPSGIKMIIGAVVMQILGGLMIWKISNVEY